MPAKALSPQSRQQSSAPRLTKNRIATLSSRQINQMEDDELCRVIRAACLSFMSKQTESRMPLQDRPTLVRMAFVARRNCQHLS